jgi:hypothetical protein
MLIALVTCARLPRLTKDDRLLAEALRELDAETQAVIWDDPSVNWTSFDAIVVRSTWDYHLRIDDFLAWLDRLEACRARVWNPVPVLRWNANKSYLHDLDVPRVPTVFVPRGGDTGVAMRTHGWLRAVVKPAVSATAFETHVVESGGLATRDVLVQPFVDEVVSEGEWSLLFFGGQYSHAVLKRVREGDFRVQSDFGGTAEVSDPRQELVAQAARVISAAPPALYARVDGVVIAGVFTLMELELIEPVLFLGMHAVAPRHLAGLVLSAAADGSKASKGDPPCPAEANECRSALRR